MKRLIDYFLLEWKARPHHKPLLLRGARQVGKTHAIRELGKQFSNFIEVNLELNTEAQIILAKDMDPHRIVRQLSELLQTSITPGSTLLFFDELQAVPQAITALRYFYELMPDLHVAAAGSLLDFAIEQVGMPVGRVSSLYLGPMSFIEFLAALGNHGWIQSIAQRSLEDTPNEALHTKLLDLVGEYLAIGGMPEAVLEWSQKKASRDVKIVHSDLIHTYQRDFDKYAKKHQIKYLSILFKNSLSQLSTKFMYTRIGEYQKRELEPALELLKKAGLVHTVTRTAGQGIPLGAQAMPHDFKIIFLDVGLTQALLNLDLSSWFIEPKVMFVNKGQIVEAFVGQELLAYTDSLTKNELFYWRRESRASQAEVDYLIQIKDCIIPVEVKAGASKHITSMQLFLETHAASPYGIRFSAQQYGKMSKMHSYPLYAVLKPLLDISEPLQQAVAYLIK